jgi:hypothetical protein
MLRRPGGGDRPDRSGKGNEEGVTLVVDLVTALCVEGVPTELAVSLERMRVELRAELLQQPGRTLDVGEEQGDSARGKLSLRRHPSRVRRVPWRF